MICPRCKIDFTPTASKPNGYCRQCNRNRQRRILAERKAAGLCAQCGGPPRTGMKMCAVCVAAQSRSKHTVEEREHLLVRQNGVCAVCQLPFKSRRNTHGDHNHTTGEKRGLLCSRCNHLVGHIETRPWLIDAAYNYLGVSA